MENLFVIVHLTLSMTQTKRPVSLGHRLARDHKLSLTKERDSRGGKMTRMFILQK